MEIAGRDAWRPRPRPRLHPSCGLFTLVTLAALGGCANAGGEASPPFELSGVIEGFYGTPWSHEDRIDVLQFMGRVGLRAYFYAPKDDPYHRTRWRDPYPEAELERLRELVETAAQAGVEFWYAISPGLTMTYSSDGDYDALIGKIEQVSELGVAHFGLFVDDVPADLTQARDRQAFGTLAAAHVHLTNKLHADLKARGQTLALTPTTYSGAWGDRDYVAAVGEGVAQDIPIFWTGIDVASPTVTRAQADDWGNLLRRKPLLWDNYPVNDYARWRLFLGPFTGRAPDLARSVSGIIANPMNEAHASMIALATLADYARDPGAYDPQRSLTAALQTLYGPDAADLDPFIEVFGDYGWESNLFEPLYILRDTIDLAPIEGALDALESAVTTLEQNGAAGNQALAILSAELEPFVSKNRQRVESLRADLSYEADDHLLVYRKSLDRYTAPATTDAVMADGDLSEWSVGATEWLPLFEPAGGTSGSQIAFRWDSNNLYIAFDIRTDRITVREGSRLGEGDHIALVIDADPTGARIGPDDLYILLPPPGGETDRPIVTSLRFEGFMAKWLADNRALTFTEFHLSSFGSAPSATMAPMAAGITYGTRRSDTGYTAEVALPHMGRERIHLSLTVTSTTGGKRVQSLARRNYPVNPVTFAEIELVSRT